MSSLFFTAHLELEVLAIDWVRLAIGLDGPRDHTDVLDRELFEACTEADRKPVDRMRLVGLDPRHQARDLEHAVVSRHAEHDFELFADDWKLMGGDVDPANRQVE